MTGGEPLVRRNVMSLVRSLSRHLGSGALDELTLTTNGSQLARFADELADCGVRRINVSLDTLDPAKFRAITRWGDLDKVLAGIEAARAAGLAVKINAVALKGLNEDEIPSLMEWAHGKGMGLTLIEVMPMGDIGVGRIDQYVPLSLVRARLAQRYTMSDLDETSGGPARYVRVSRDRRQARLHHADDATISARRATACGSPAPEPCTPASDMRTRPICASRFARPPTTASRCGNRPRHRLEAEGPRFHHRPQTQPAQR